MDPGSSRYRNRREARTEQRRDFLVKALTLGVFAAGGLPAMRRARAMAAPPKTLPPGQSVYRLDGDVRVNGALADRDTRIGPNSTIETGSNSEIVFVVGKDAFMMRDNGRLELSSGRLAEAGNDLLADEDGLAASILSGLRLVTGQLVSTFGERDNDEPLSMRTPTATVGIRGTGIYVEAGTERSYVCTCYGATELAARGDPASRERITSEHHDAPRYILDDAPQGQRIQTAPVIDHTDMELTLIEELVGRTPPFASRGSPY